MIDRKVAIELYPLTNDPEDMKSLVAYADYRIDQIHYELENANTIDEVRRLQGAIYELNKLKGLKEEVKSVVNANST